MLDFGRRRFLADCPRHLGPGELTCGPAAVAVDTPHVTFLDLGQNLWPWLATRKPSDITTLRGWIPVIELKDHRIDLAAVDAGMCKQIRQQKRAIRDPISGHPRDLATDVVVTVPKVVASPVGRVTGPAVVLTSPRSYVRERELSFRLRFAAHVAGEHGLLPKRPALPRSVL